MNIKQLVQDLFKTIISLFIPDKCFNCQAELGDSEFYICKNCLDKLPRYKNDREKVFSLFEFNDVTQKIIWLLKYDKRPELGEYLGKYLFNELKKYQLLPENINYQIIPIPLHPKRLKKRGYNQSGMIGKGICLSANNITLSKKIRRNVNNVSQTTLSRNKRKQNVSGVFYLNEENHEDSKGNYIIIDDVVTTGSTIKELEKVLSRLNPDYVFALTIISAQKLKYNYKTQ